ncbi:MAG: hypothetical protein L0K86_16035 [Actinomycetia bacterium]|nr:hypothetical protein [Actinomycetes bacterium]
MTHQAPTGHVAGLMPPGGRSVEVVALSPGQVWSVGRRDDGFLGRVGGQAGWHLGVPDARPDLSVNQLELRVGQVGVAVSSVRGSGVTVDGVLRPSPVVLTRGTSYVSPSASGLHLEFAVTVLRGDDFGAREGALAPSGTTLTMRIDLEDGTALWKVAHALAWPCTSAQRRPHAVGWSGRDVGERLTQLGWASASKGTTALSQQLHTLADKVANCRLSDGRRADLVLPDWPPWTADTDLGETRDQRAERRNRCVAEALWRARAVAPGVIDGTR